MKENQKFPRPKKKKPPKTMGIQLRYEYAETVEMDRGRS